MLKDIKTFFSGFNDIHIKSFILKAKMLRVTSILNVMIERFNQNWFHMKLLINSTFFVMFLNDIDF